MNEEEASSGAAIVRACRDLHMAIDALDHHAAETLGVSRNDLRCLNLLEFGPVSPTQIATRLGLTSGAVTALLDRLERAKLVERSRDMKDRRAVTVRATDLVFHQLGPLYRTYAHALIAATSAYPAAELEEALRHLGDARRACEEAVATILARRGAAA